MTGVVLLEKLELVVLSEFDWRYWPSSWQEKLARIKCLMSEMFYEISY